MIIEKEKESINLILRSGMPKMTIFDFSWKKCILLAF